MLNADVEDSKGSERMHFTVTKCAEVCVNILLYELQYSSSASHGNIHTV